VTCGRFALPIPSSPLSGTCPSSTQQSVGATATCRRAHHVRRRTDFSPHGMTQTSGWAMRTPDLSLFTRSLRFAIEARLRLGSFLAVTGSSNLLKGAAVNEAVWKSRHSPRAYRNHEAVEPEKGRAAPTRSRITRARHGLHSAGNYQPVQPVRLMMDRYQ
jgi:hypothetical protein